MLVGLDAWLLYWFGLLVGWLVWLGWLRWMALALTWAWALALAWIGIGTNQPTKQPRQPTNT